MAIDNVRDRLSEELLRQIAGPGGAVTPNSHGFIKGGFGPFGVPIPWMSLAIPGQEKKLSYALNHPESWQMHAPQPEAIQPSGNAPMFMGAQAVGREVWLGNPETGEYVRVPGLGDQDAIDAANKAGQGPDSGLSPGKQPGNANPAYQDQLLQQTMAAAKKKEPSGSSGTSGAKAATKVVRGNRSVSVKQSGSSSSPDVVKGQVVSINR